MIKFDDYREKYSHIRMERQGGDSADNLSYRGGGTQMEWAVARAARLRLR